MKKALTQFILLFLLPAISLAQPAAKDLSGVWKGEFYVDSTKKTWPFELTVSEDNGKLSGYSRIAFEEDGVKHVVFRDHKIKIQDDKIIIEDVSELSKASSINQPKEVKKTMTLTLNTVDSLQVLKGTWTTNKTKHFLVATGTAQLEKKKNYRETEIFKKLDELALTQKLSFNTEPEAPWVLNRVVLNDVAAVDLPKKEIRRSVAVTAPNPKLKPKDAPLAKIEKEPEPVVKAEPKKPAAPVVKATPPPKAKEPVVAKNDKPVTPPQTKPAPVTAAPVVKKANSYVDAGNAAADVASRVNTNEQALYFAADSLQLTLYDNGEIDGDTVSVLLNGKVIIAKQGLNTKPNVHTIYFDRDSPDSQMLVMYAENLGSIPPNTGLLIVREGQSVYEVRFSADLKTNAAVILRRKKKPTQE